MIHRRCILLRYRKAVKQGINDAWNFCYLLTLSISNVVVNDDYEFIRLIVHWHRRIFAQFLLLIRMLDSLLVTFTHQK